MYAKINELGFISTPYRKVAEMCIRDSSKFKAEVYILKKEEGGRHTPFHNKYRPQFYLRTMRCV